VLARVRACGQMCAHVHVGARACMPKGDTRRRALGGTEKRQLDQVRASTEDNTINGGVLVIFWAQLARRRDTKAVVLCSGCRHAHTGALARQDVHRCGYECLKAVPYLQVCACAQPNGLTSAASRATARVQSTRRHLNLASARQRDTEGAAAQLDMVS
jgi:hypothetical protein